MRPTMADVAEQAGVSTTTVSLVLNDRPGVSNGVRASVLQAVKELGYRLPRRRPFSTSAKTKTITIIHFAGSGIGQGAGVSGISINYVNGIQDYCQSQNVNWALIANYAEGDDQQVGYYLGESEKLVFDGLIMLETVSSESTLLQQAIRDGIPTVVVSRHWSHLPVTLVGQDHRQQAQLALDHLIGLGHRQIAFIAQDRDRVYEWFDIRLRCYTERMTRLGTFDQELIAIGADISETAKALVARRPDATAILAVNDSVAVVAMRGLLEAGLCIPEQLSVIGLDDSIPAPAGYPGLTTVAFPHYRVGQLAAEMLVRQLDDNDMLYSHVFVRSSLVERASCAPPRAS